MESSGGRGRKGMKGRLARTLHKTPKPATSPLTQYYGSKVVNVPATAALCYVVDDSSHANNINSGSSSTAYVSAAPVPKHCKPPNSLVKLDVVRVAARAPDGGDHVGDDNIDMRAALYISSTRERFRLSQIDHEWR